MNKIGVLQAKRILFGWGKDLEIVVDGERFYKRIGNKNLHKFNVRDKVNVEYEEIKTSLGDWIGDRILLIGCGIPRNYKEIIKISRLD